MGATIGHGPPGPARGRALLVGVALGLLGLASLPLLLLQLGLQRAIVHRAARSLRAARRRAVVLFRSRRRRRRVAAATAAACRGLGLGDGAVGEPRVLVGDGRLEALARLGGGPRAAGGGERAAGMRVSGVRAWRRAVLQRRAQGGAKA